MDTMTTALRNEKPETSADVASQENGMRLAVIDMADPNKQQLAKTLREICTRHGFFFLKGHGVDGALQQAALEQTRLLFDLALDKKREMTDSKLSRGYTAMQEETLDPVNQTVGDAKEGFYIGKDVPVDDPRYNPQKLAGPNQWPTPSDDLPEFQSTMTTYFQQLSKVGFSLVQLLALSLGLDEHHFDEAFLDPLAALRLLHYNASLESSQKIRHGDNVGIYGCGAHSDYGILTLLLTDGTPGLQIQSNHDPKTWLSVLEPPPHDGAAYYIVNLGDMLERWTNGLYKSTVHRVILELPNDDTKKEQQQDENDKSGNRRHHRYSIPFFYEPNFDTVVECLPTCVSDDNPPKYPPTTSGQHLLDKYKQTHADFTPQE